MKTCQIPAVFVVILGLCCLCAAQIRSASITEALDVDKTTFRTGGEHDGFYTLSTTKDVLVFSLKACSNGFLEIAHFEDGVSRDTIAVVIGGDFNSVTKIEVYGRDEMSADTPGILHCSEHRTFWLSWRHSFLTIGRGSVEGHDFIDLQPVIHESTKKPTDAGSGGFSNALSVQEVRFGTTQSFQGEWQVKENQGVFFHAHTYMGLTNVWKTVKYRDGHYAFQAQAEGDLQVILAAVQGFPFYELVISSDDNTIASCLNKLLPETVLTCANTSSLLGPSHVYRSFWISWLNGELQFGVGRFPSDTPLLNYTEYEDEFPGIEAIAFGYDGHAVNEVILDEHLGGHYTFHSDPNTDGYAHGDVKDFILTPKQNRMSFRVHACQDAVVALCQDPASADADFTYFIHIGSSDNSKITLHIPFSPEIVEVDTPGVLSCSSETTFWMSWEGSHIRLGKGYAFADPLLDYDTGFDHFVNSVGFGNAGSMAGIYWYVLNTDGDGASVTTMSEHNDYRQFWIGVPQELYKVFRVRACQNVHLLLAEMEGSSSVGYEVVIGLDNEKTVIRESMGADDEESAETRDVLSCVDFRTFWLSWVDRRLRVGRGHKHGHNQLVAMETEMLHSVGALSISTEGAEAIWQFENDRGGYLWSATSETSIEWLMLKEEATWMYFGVAGGPARLTLTSKYRRNSGAYQIIIGANNNTETWLQEDGRTLLTESTPSILSETDMRDFWVSWQNGISFGQGRYKNWHNVFEYNDHLHDVEAVGISADVSDSSVEWRLFTENGVELSHDTHDHYSTEQLSLDVSHVTHIVFGVKACNSATLLLSAIPHLPPDGDHVCEIQVQDAADYTYIRCQDSEGVRIKHQGLLSCDEERFFWLSWQDGYIAVGIGTTRGAQPILATLNTHPFPVKSLSISTVTSVGYWRFPLSDEDFQEIFHPADQPPSSGLSGGEIFGIVVGTLFLLVLVVVAGYILYNPDVLRIFSSSSTSSDGMTTPTVSSSEFSNVAASGFEQAYEECGTSGTSTKAAGLDNPVHLKSETPA